MMEIKRKAVLCAVALSASTVFSQEQVHSSSSQYLPAYAKPDVNIAYDIKSEGKRYNPTWGLDQAWANVQNLRKGMNHMKKENVGIGRSSFRVLKPLVNDNSLTTDQIAGLSERSQNFNIVSTKLPLVLNCDNGYRPEGHTGSNINTYYTSSNGVANVENWAKMITLHIDWMKKNTQHPIVGVSPFNEPDLNGDGNSLRQGSASGQASVAEKLRTDENYSAKMKDIAITGGNTLNDDKAKEWYNPGKTYYDWGNTHQLAGSMANYIAFHDQLQADGKVGYNDEMHNVVEPMVGLEHGLSVGIWWGFDSRTRGEFCDITRHGVRLAYGEHRTNWTAAAVYRHDNGKVKAFIGGSERQAATTKYQFVSIDRDVYYNGFGPVREYMMEIPGGRAGSYQNGQTNAETVIDVTWGEDVPLGVINGTYKIVNKATGNLLAVSGNTIQQQKDQNKPIQQWTVVPVSKTIGGDYSYYNIESVSNPMIHINVRDFSTVANADIIAYKQNAIPTTNEQWHLEYAGEGYYFIRNRESALYLASKSSSNWSGVGVTQTEEQTGSSHDLILWRLLPTTVSYETTAPAKPIGLSVISNPASVTLTWNENTESDLTGYLVLRSLKGTNEWNTIARNIKTNYFTDNTCRQGEAYIYKVKTVDAAQNVSEASDVAEAIPTGERSLIARWSMNETLNDDTPNLMDAVSSSADALYVDCPATGTKGVSLSSSRFLQLPYSVANSEELTIGMWVNWRSTGTWQRIFDFGYDTDHYMFLTPSTGSVMRFAIKNGGNEQTVDCNSRLSVNSWKHVVVSIGKDKTSIYIDGAEAASSTSISIRPTDILPVMNYLGRSQFISDPAFNGYLADVRVYNYAVNADEVLAMMNGEVPSSIQSKEINQDESPQVYGLDGIRRSEPRSGLNILNGKKVVKQ